MQSVCLPLYLPMYQHSIHALTAHVRLGGHIAKAISKLLAQTRVADKVQPNPLIISILASQW